MTTDATPAGQDAAQSERSRWAALIVLCVGMLMIVLDEGIGLANGADVAGAALVTSSLMLAVYTIVGPAAEQGWGAGRTLVLGAVSLVLLIAFVIREATARTPLIPLRIFRSRNISGANLIQVVSVAGMFGMFFMGSLYLEQVLRYDALQIGLAFLPGTIIMGVLSLGYSHRLIMRFGARTVMMPAFMVVAGGLALFTRAPVDGDYVAHVLPTMIMFGIGGGIGFPALMTISMSGVEARDAGLASGLVNTTAQVGGALGLAVLATLATTRTEGLRSTGDPLAAALTGGYHLAFAIAALLMVVAILIGVFVLSPDRAAAREASQEHAGAEPTCEPA